MSGITDYERRKALEALDELFSYSISKMFAEPVDPVRDKLPTYFEIIENPMDLGTIRKKLLSNEYDSILDFKKDVQLVWDNSKKFNGPQSIIASLAKTLQQIFQHSTEFLSGNDHADWQNECDKLAANMQIKINYGKQSYQSALSSIVSMHQQSTASGNKNETRKVAPTRSSSRRVNYDEDALSPPIPEKTRSSERKKPLPSRSHSTVANTSPPHPPSQRSSSASSRRSAKQAMQKIEKELEEEAAPPPIVPLIEEVPRPKDIPLTKEEQIKLTEDVNGIEDEYYQSQIIDFITERQPELVDEEGNIDISIDRLSDSTTIGLRKLVTDILKHLA